MCMGLAYIKYVKGGSVGGIGTLCLHACGRLVAQSKASLTPVVCVGFFTLPLASNTSSNFRHLNSFSKYIL